MAAKKQNLGIEPGVLEFIREHNLVRSGETVLVAVSGGPDSVSLLYLLYRLRSELNISLHIAHLNHQLRGHESDADERYVADLARDLNIPATIENRDVAKYQSEHHLSLEEAAREVRYSFLTETAQLLGIDKVAVGHTLNDQVETILLHIIRGTGTQGLIGLQPRRVMQFSERRVTIIRPLLNIKREETEEYCSKLHLTPCLDTSNLSLSPLRNRVRRELLPLLQSYNAGVFESILRVSQIAGDDLSFLEAETEKVKTSILHKEGNLLIFNKSGFLELAPALQRQLLRQTILELLGTLKDIEARHIEEILGALKKPAGKHIILPEGLIFGVEYGRYWLGFHPEELIPWPQLSGEFNINVPGKTCVSGWTIEAAVMSRERITERQVASVSNAFSAYFDNDKVAGPIKMRARRRGDRFQPLGMTQLKRVGEFMLDAAIPQTWRERVPVIYSPQQIIWLAGWRIDDRVKVTDNTRRVLCLTLRL